MSRFVRNTAWLTAAQISGLIVPLIEIPFLARGLGQVGLGQVMYVSAIALAASVFIEFGFNISAARSVVLVRYDSRRLAQLVSDVTLAKFLISLIVGTFIAFFVITNVGAIAVPHRWLIWIIFFMIGFGFTPIWFYVGIERLAFPAILDVCIRSAGLIAIILLITSETDAELVLIIQSSVGLLNTVVATLMMLKIAGWGKLRIEGAVTVFKQSWTLFLYKGGQSILGSVSSIILGAVSGALAVGAYAPAEKLFRASSGFTGPILTALFPRAVASRSLAGGEAKKIAGLALGALFSIATLLSIMVSFWSGWLIGLIFGQGYQEAAHIVALLIWALPFRAGSATLAIIWFIPIGKDSMASKNMLLTVVLIVIFGLILIPNFGATGMAAAVLISEVICFGILLYSYIRSPDVGFKQHERAPQID